MKHTDLSLEDVCPRAGKIRDETCREKFIRIRYSNDISRCVDELNKARRGLAALNILAPRVQDLEDIDCDLKSIMQNLDSVVIPNPNQFKDFFLESPSLVEHVADPNFFKIKRFSSANNSFLVKPVFSLEKIELSKAMYAYYSFSTKLIFLFLEMAHLEYWAIRFYSGLGYVKVAVKIWRYLAKRYPSLKEQLDALHLVITHTSLTGLGILRTNSHEDCGCTFQIRVVIKSCSDLLHIYSLFEKDDPLSDLKENCSIGSMFDSLVISSTEGDLENKIVSRQLAITMLSALLEKNAELAERRKDSSTEEENDMDTVAQACKATEPAFIAYGDQYLLAAKRYIVGCNFSLSSCDEKFSSCRIRVEEAVEFFTECEKTLRMVPYKEFESDGRYKPLFQLLMTARTLLNLRRLVYTIHLLTPEEKVQHFITLRNLENLDLPKEKLLDDQTRNKLLAAAALVHVYLGRDARELMGFKGKKYSKRLRAGLQEAKRLAETLLLEEANSLFCRNMISDFAERWNDDCEPGQEKPSFLLERSLLLLQGLAPLACLSRGGKLTAPIEHDDTSSTQSVLAGEVVKDNEVASDEDKRGEGEDERKCGENEDGKGGEDDGKGEDEGCEDVGGKGCEDVGGEGGEDKGGRGGEDKGGRGGEEKGGKGDEDKGGKGDEDKGGKGDEDRGGRGGEDKGGRGSEEKGGKGDEDKGGRGGEDKRGRGGEDEGGRGGEDEGGRGGEDEGGRGGEDEGGRGGEDEGGRGGEDEGGRGGEDERGRGGDDKGGKGGEDDGKGGEGAGGKGGEDEGGKGCEDEIFKGGKDEEGKGGEDDGGLCSEDEGGLCGKDKGSKCGKTKDEVEGVDQEGVGGVEDVGVEEGGEDDVGKGGGKEGGKDCGKDEGGTGGGRDERSKGDDGGGGEDGGIEGGEDKGSKGDGKNEGGKGGGKDGRGNCDNSKDKGGNGGGKDERGTVSGEYEGGQGGCKKGGKDGSEKGSKCGNEKRDNCGGEDTGGKGAGENTGGKGAGKAQGTKGGAEAKGGKGGGEAKGSKGGGKDKGGKEGDEDEDGKGGGKDEGGKGGGKDEGDKGGGKDEGDKGGGKDEGGQGGGKDEGGKGGGKDEGAKGGGKEEGGKSGDQDEGGNGGDEDDVDIPTATTESEIGSSLVEEYSDRFFKSPRVQERPTLEELYRVFVGSKITERVENTLVLRGTDKWSELKEIARKHLKKLYHGIIQPGSEKMDAAVYENRGQLTDAAKLLESLKILQDVTADESEVLSHLSKVADILRIKTEFDMKDDP